MENKKKEKIFTVIRGKNIKFGNRGGAKISFLANITPDFSRTPCWRYRRGCVRVKQLTWTAAAARKLSTISSISCAAYQISSRISRQIRRSKNAPIMEELKNPQSLSILSLVLNRAGSCELWQKSIRYLETIPKNTKI